MTAIYGFTDAKEFAVLCADNHSPADPVDKLARVGKRLAIGASGQPFVFELLRDLNSSLRASGSELAPNEFAREMEIRLAASLTWFVPAFEAERERRKGNPDFDEWDRLMRENPVRLAAVDLKHLTLHELHFGWPLPPKTLRPVRSRDLGPGVIWRFGRPEPRVQSPDTALLDSDPASVFAALLREDSGPGVGSVGTLITVHAGRVRTRFASGAVSDETLETT